MTSEQALLCGQLHREMWGGMGGDARWTESTVFADDVAIRSPFACTDLAAAAFATCGSALYELLNTVEQVERGIRVGRALASEWFRFPPIPPSRPVDAPPDLGRPISANDDSSVFAAVGAHSGPSVWSSVYPSADDRWIYLRGGGAKALKALGVEEDHMQVAAAIRSGYADEIERAVVEAGGTIAANRTIEEWLAHPQGRAVGAEPFVHVRVTGSSSDSWQPTPGRPLAGIRVLDLTRVLAGPLGTRFLAAAGAEVLRLDAPNSDESRRPGMLADAMLGKRWAFLDIRTGSGRRRFLELLSTADVFVHGYRPGGIDQLIPAELREQVRPGLVEVALNAYGWTGPWKTRRGYDTVTQWSIGIADATARWAAEDPANRLPLNALGRLVDASRPRHMPVEALDFATGYCIAAAAIRGITRRLLAGVGSVSHLSLARTAAVLIGPGKQPDAPPVEVPINGPLDPQVYTVNGKPTRRLQWPVDIDGIPLFWEHQGDIPGASTPQWNSSRA